MSIFSRVSEALAIVCEAGYQGHLVDKPPSTDSGLGVASVLVVVRPLRVDFGGYGSRDRHIGAVDVHSVSMASAWNSALLIAQYLRGDCETQVYDLRPNYPSANQRLPIASLKVGSWYMMNSPAFGDLAPERSPEFSDRLIRNVQTLNGIPL